MGGLAGGGGGGGGAGLGLAGGGGGGLRLPLWLLDALLVCPVLAVVALDVHWNMDAAARASPLLMVVSWPGVLCWYACT